VEVETQPDATHIQAPSQSAYEEASDDSQETY